MLCNEYEKKRVQPSIDGLNFQNTLEISSFRIVISGVNKYTHRASAAFKGLLDGFECN